MDRCWEKAEAMKPKNSNEKLIKNATYIWKGSFVTYLDTNIQKTL